MKTLQEWAEYYFKNGIYICPPDENPIFKNWKTFRQTLNDVKSYCWESQMSIYGIAGKIGIRIIRLIADRENKLYRKYFVDKITTILSLERYPWIIDNKDTLDIVINSAPSFVEDTIWDKIDNVCIIYKSPFNLPSIGDEPRFYFHGIPTVKPAHIKGTSLKRCIEILEDDTIFLNKYVNHLTD